MAVTRTLALELARHGIRVNAVAPGVTKTPASGTYVDDDPERDRRAIAMGRRGRPEEVAGAIVFLLSDLSSYLTPGVPVQITIKNPANDFYCTYAPNPFYYFDSTTYTYQPVNPQYNAYPGCRKAVFATHNWSGVLLVQTSSTQAI